MPTFYVPVTVEVSCENKEEAADFQQSVVDHLLETFNDTGDLVVNANSDLIEDAIPDNEGPRFYLPVTFECEVEHKEAAEDFQMNVANHLMETFNDNGSIAVHYNSDLIEEAPDAEPKRKLAI